jgi:DNA ligase-1
MLNRLTKVLRGRTKSNVPIGTKEAKQKEYDRVYREKNKELIAKKAAEYRLKTIERRNEYDRIYRENNKELIAKKAAEYRVKNRDRRIEYDRIRRAKKENKEKRKEYTKLIKERTRAYSQIYRSLPENKEKARQKYIEKMKKIVENYVYRPARYSWKDINSLKSFFDKASQMLRITELTDWYRISLSQIQEAGGAGLVAHYGSLCGALKLVYPEYAWDSTLFTIRNKKSAQRWLLLMMKQLLPNEVIIEDFREHPVLIWEDSGKHVQIDIWVPRYNLGLEYQGEQHTIDLPQSGYIRLDKRIQKDKEKAALCFKNGIILVQIFHWWNKSSESLSSTLNQYLPDVFPKTSSPPIPTELPLDYKKVKKPRTLKAVMQGCDYHDENPEGWFMSEKLDGMRAYWDGERFWSKNMSIIDVPESFTAGFPTFPVDGELWGGYEKIDSTVYALKQACRKKKRNIDWSNIKFCAFDAPQEEGSYDKRHLFLQNNLSQCCNISLIPMQKCGGHDHLHQHLAEILDKGGEGIILYHPATPYQPGRTRNVLKFKKYFEASVTFSHVKRDSYNLVCKQENGKLIYLKCTRGFCLSPPEVGEKILVRHQGIFARSQKYKYPVSVIHSTLNGNIDLLNKNKE